MSDWPFIANKSTLNIVATDDAYLVTNDGARILDGAGGAISTNIGLGREDVARVIYEATKQNTYALPPWATPERLDLVRRLKNDWLPSAYSRMHFTCGGSEAIECAIKIAAQYFKAQGRPEKCTILGRQISYHGTTIATTAA